MAPLAKKKRVIEITEQSLLVLTALRSYWMGDSSRRGTVFMRMCLVEDIIGHFINESVRLSSYGAWHQGRTPPWHVSYCSD